MIKKVLPYCISLLFAVLVHIIILFFLDTSADNSSLSESSRFSLFLLENSTQSEKPPAKEQSLEKAQQKSEPDILPSTETVNIGLLPSAESTLETSSIIVDSVKPSQQNTIPPNTADFYLKSENSSLLDLSSIDTQIENNDDTSVPIFSSELRSQIEASQTAQDEYLKGIKQEIEYPITEGADGTRYVNIKGVCWRIPNPDTNEPWAIVVAGCSGQTESFKFELNISPSTILGRESLFSSD